MQYAARRHLPLTVITVVENVTPGWPGMLVMPTYEQDLSNTGASSTSSWAKAAAARRSTGTSSGQCARNCQTFEK
jgi:hypothetical protein